MLKVNQSSGEVEVVSIFDLMDGAVQERAELVMKDILANIANPNTDAKKARTMTVKFSFVANEQRDEVSLDVQCEGKLAPIKGIATHLTLGEQEGEPVAVEQTKAIPGQMNLSGGEQTARKIVNMGDARRA